MIFNHPKNNYENELIPDHITHHPNKVTLKSTQKTKKNQIAEIKTYFLPSKGEAKIILLKSFFLTDGLHLLKENINFSPEWKDLNPKFNQEVLIADLIEPIDFSLLLVLVPTDSKNNFEFLETCAITDKNGKEIKLSSLKHPGFNIGLINVFPNHNILVFPTSYIHDNSRCNEGPFWKIFHPVFSEIKNQTHL